MDYQQLEANNMTFSYLEMGPRNGPLALCLHGFPDAPQTWRHLLPRLAKAGYHAVAPAMRGYAPSDLAPDGGYQVGALSSDANAIHAALGGDADAVLIGHDWGAAACYGAINSAPRRWSKAVAMAVPPFAAVATSFLTFDQLQRSWYMFFFQNALADVVVTMNDCEFIDRLWADWSPGFDATEDLGYVKACIGSDERMQAALGYYRAMFDETRHVTSYAAEQEALMAPGTVPTLYLHGRQDGCFSLEAAGDPTAFLGEGSSMQIIEDAGHFMHLEQPEVVNDAVINFLTAS
ncbi:MAG: alpha/beta hydrolase [Actinomycetota bacterium]